MDINKSGGRLKELDALRGIAAVLVMIFHFTWQIDKGLPGAASPPVGLWWGRYGVELFFAISGFVIFMTLERTERAQDFVVSRFSRLFPAYWAGIIITSIAVRVLPEPHLAHPVQDILLNFTMVQGFFYRFNIDAVYWTLTVELAFYACMLGLWRLRALGRIEAVLIGWLAFKLVWWAYPNLPYRVSMIFLLEYIPYFALGIAVYRVWAGARKWVQQIPVLSLACLAATLDDPAKHFYVFVIVLGVMIAMERGWLARLQHPFAVWMGALSYPLYLIHENIGWAIMDHLGKTGMSPWLTMCAAIVVSVALAAFINTVIEKPIQGKIRTWWKRRRVAAHPKPIVPLASDANVPIL
jgi:peptidoglycan/LPS O-acetylase OafA/YrhL